MMEFDYSSLYEHLRHTAMKRWLDDLPQQVEQALYRSNNGNLPRWIKALEGLPDCETHQYSLDTDAVSVGEASECDSEMQRQIERHLKGLLPWRKGPYNLFGVDLNTEWRSDWKWNRLLPHLKPLAGKRVLDIGCGNGYHVWRMIGAGAQWALGIDPYLLYVMQYWAIRHFLKEVPGFVLPISVEQLPEARMDFDTVFSMGVLYHVRSPFEHLMTLKNCLRPGGEFVLETLVIDGKQGEVLVPEGRYARMRNVWFLPSCLTLESWLKRCQLKNIRLVDVNQTSLEEQRATPWMQFESLIDCLKEEDINQTVEGLPAPKRAIFIAEV